MPIFICSTCPIHHSCNKNVVSTYLATGLIIESRLDSLKSSKFVMEYLRLVSLFASMEFKQELCVFACFLASYCQYHIEIT